MMSVNLPSETVGSNELIISPTLWNEQFTKTSEVNAVCILTFRTNYEVIIQAYDSSLVSLSDISSTKIELE